MKHISRFLPVFIIGTCLTGSPQSAPIASEEPVTGPESIASLPFDRRVCRLSVGGIEPLTYDPLQGKEVPRVQLFGMTPEEVADIVAWTGADF